MSDAGWQPWVPGDSFTCACGAVGRVNAAREQACGQCKLVFVNIRALPPTGLVYMVDHDAATPPADPIDLSMIYATHARGADGALDFLFETADDAYDARRFADYSAAVAALDFDRLADLAVIVGVAVTLLWPKLAGDVLPDRDVLVARVATRVRALAPDRFEALMQGLW